MQRFKKILALSTVVLLMVSLVGCQGGGSENSTSTGDSSEPSKVYCDFGGATVTIVDEYEVMENADGTVNARFQARLDQVQKDFNVKIDIIQPKGNYSMAMIASIVSGKPAGHILSTRDVNVVNWYQAGVFADLTAAMQKTGITLMDSKVYDTNTTIFTNYDGKQNCFGRNIATAVSGVWTYNKRIFNEMNLEDPQELYAKGEWTWDKVEEIATKATIRKSDGTVTQWGLASGMAMTMLGNMILSNGGSIATFDETGKPVIGLKDPKTMAAMERFNSWMNVKKIMRTNWGNEVWDTVNREFPNGNIAMFAGNVISYAVEANMKDEYAIVGAPKASLNSEYLNPKSGFPCFFIPKTYEADADRYLALIDALWQPYEDVSMTELYTETWAENLYDEESLNMFVKLAENPLPTPFDAYTILNLEWNSPSVMEIVTCLMNGESPGTVADQYQTALQQLAEETWGEIVLTGR